MPACPEGARYERGGTAFSDGDRQNFGATEVLKEVSLEVPRGEFHTLLGPSGSGKTTLLKVIAGSPRPMTAGHARGEGHHGHPPEHRNIGVVFQNYALFPHMTVAQNVAFGLKMRGVAKGRARAPGEAVLRLVRMTGFGDRRPAALSGGQQQRVALARALVIRPDLLLARRAALRARSESAAGGAGGTEANPGRDARDDGDGHA